MYFIYDDNIVNYEEYKTKNRKKSLIVLHGWRQSISQFKFLKNELQDTDIYIIDLPNFGESSVLKKQVNLDYYVNFLREFIKAKDLKNIVLLGHSFGGRILIKYLSTFKNEGIKQCILVDAAGIKTKHNLKYYFKIYAYKICKKFNKKINWGSLDYKDASNILKGTLSNIVNEDLTIHLKEIKLETLIIWGSEDLVTPLKDCYLMNKLIEKSEIAIIPGAGHFSYNDNKNYFCSLIRGFIHD